MTWLPWQISSPGVSGATSWPSSSTTRTRVKKNSLPVEPARAMASSGLIRQAGPQLSVSP